MIRRFGFCLLLAAAWGSPSRANAAALQPLQKWVVEFAEQQCVASRPYGQSERPLTLVFKPSPIGQVLQVTLIREASGPTRQLAAEIVADDDAPIRAKALAFDVAEGRRRITRINLPAAFSRRLGAARTLSLSLGEELDETLELSNMASLVKAMDQCLSDLQGYWNISPASQGRLKVGPSGNLRQWFSDKDYPDTANFRDQSGNVEFALLVDENGRVADCSVVETSDIPVLDAQSCAILSTRAKLNPAIGKDGKPAKGALTGRIAWVQPDQWRCPRQAIAQPCLDAAAIRGKRGRESIDGTKTGK